MTIKEPMFYVLWKSLFSRGIGVRDGDKVLEAHKDYTDHLKHCLKECLVKGVKYVINKIPKAFQIKSDNFELTLDKSLVRQKAIVRILAAAQECNSVKEFCQHKYVYRFLNIHRFDVFSYKIIAELDNVVTYDVIKGKYTGLVSVDYNNKTVVNQGSGKFTFDSFLYLETKTRV